MTKNYLAEYDKTPRDEQYPLVQKWMREEPLPFFKQLREERPILETPECTLVARFFDVRDLLQMPRIMTVDLYKPKMGVTGPDDGYLMAHDDDALHYREKSIMQGVLNRDDLPRVRRMVGETAARVLREAGGKIDLAYGYGRTVPAHLVQDYFGLTGIGRDDLIRWSYWNQYDAFNNQPFDMRTDAEYRKIVEEHDHVTFQLVTYIGVLVARKLAWLKIRDLAALFLSPLRKLALRIANMAADDLPDDMTSRLLRTKFAKQIDFPITRAAINVGGYLIGAIETTNQAVVQAVAFLMADPDRLKMAKDAAREAETDRFDAIVWEALRFVPIRVDIFRQASEDVTVAKGTDHETEIKSGTIVRLLILSAMFDPNCHDDPEAFAPGRDEYHNFTFGYGSHQCLGKYIGIEMIPEMVRQVMLLDDAKPVGPISYHNADVLPTIEHGPFPERFDVTWTA